MKMVGGQDIEETPVSRSEEEIKAAEKTFLDANEGVSSEFISLDGSDTNGEHDYTEYSPNLEELLPFEEQGFVQECYRLVGECI